MVPGVVSIWGVGVFVLEVLGDDNVVVKAVLGTKGGYNSSSE
jgi:hypothetical protein